MLRLFISSVQKDFAGERAALRDYLHGDSLLRRFFAPFLFEDVPAADRRAESVYLDEVAQCDVYVCLLGEHYGPENTAGLSATQREFAHATQLQKHRLVFIKGADDRTKHPKMQAPIAHASGELIRSRFGSTPELIAGVYAALVQFLEHRKLIRHGPFDAAVCPDATLDDISAEKVGRFVGVARRARGFPLAEDTPTAEVLEHLHLLRKGQPTHAAILLFGTDPQRFLISSEIKCARFHGTQVAKPIPFYQVYKGTVFDLVDQAVDFVLSKIDLAVGTRAESMQAPVAYEMPPEVVREAIVNAVAHRDYTSNGSVQVMLFSDRVEVWNPGTLPPSLTLEKLRHAHSSVPGNPLLAEPLYLTKYIERMGTGTGDMIDRCRAAGLPEPEFTLTDGFVITLRRKPERAFESVGGQVTGQVAGEVAWQVTGVVTGQVAGQVTGQVAGQVAEEVRRGLLVLQGARSRKQLQESLRLRGRANFEERYLKPALETGMVEPTLPDKPNSRLQKYRLTAQGRAWLAAQPKGSKA